MSNLDFEYLDASGVDLPLISLVLRFRISYIQYCELAQDSSASFHLQTGKHPSHQVKQTSHPINLSFPAGYYVFVESAGL